MRIITAEEVLTGLWGILNVLSPIGNGGYCVLRPVKIVGDPCGRASVQPSWQLSRRLDHGK